MGEGRNLELEIVKKARKEAMRGTAIVICFAIISILLKACISEVSLLFFIFVIPLELLVILGTFLVLERNCIAMEEERIESEFAEREVPITNHVEVKPTEENDNKEFMEKQSDTVKFYAIRNERKNIIEIDAKFVGEEEFYKYTAVTKRKFQELYEVVKENTEGN